LKNHSHLVFGWDFGNGKAEFFVLRDPFLSFSPPWIGESEFGFASADPAKKPNNSFLSDIAESLIATGRATPLLTKCGEIAMLLVAKSSFACVAITPCRAKTTKCAFANSTWHIEILIDDFLLIVILWVELAEIRSRHRCF
jgi:hypothetical protein